MKYITSEQVLTVPDNVKLDINSRIVTVTGPKGTLSKNLRHVDVAFEKVDDSTLKLTIYHGDRKKVATLRTIKSLVDNMITGVTKGYKYKMRYVYAHFPINVNLLEGGSVIEIRNFLGDKRVRTVPVREGVKAEISTAQKDELVLSGISVDDVSQTAADVHQACLVRNKDIRKFLDGIYVSEKGFIEEEE